MNRVRVQRRAFRQPEPASNRTVMAIYVEQPDNRHSKRRRTENVQRRTTASGRNVRIRSTQRCGAVPATNRAYNANNGVNVVRR